MRTLIGLLTLLFVVGCRGPVDFEAAGVPVQIATSADWANAPDAQERITHVIREARSYWGGDSWKLGWYKIKFVDGSPPLCGKREGYSILGCTSFVDRLIEIRADEYAGVEQTSLFHEIQHALNGDPHHASEKWDTDKLRTEWDWVVSDTQVPQEIRDKKYWFWWNAPDHVTSQK